MRCVVFSIRAGGPCCSVRGHRDTSWNFWGAQQELTYVRLTFAFFLMMAITAAQPGPGRDSPVHPETRSRVTSKAASNIERYYFDERLAKQMADAIRSKHTSGGYDSAVTAMQLSTALETDMRAVSRDGHIRVFWSAAPLPGFNPDQPPPPPSEEQLRQARLLAQKTNGFVTDANWLPGNIGYLSLDAFGDPASMKEQLGYAMSMLRHTDALLIDMRTNKGGSPASVALLASYLFGEAPVHLNDIVSPRDNRVQEFWTTSELDGARYGLERPVYVLTAKETFSAPEELAYDLQVLKRAVVVGENTGGGANPASGVPIDEHFVMAIPRAQARNPHTGTNWEGVGVRPDVNVSAEAAKDAAYLLALLKVRELPDSPPFVRDQVNQAIEKLLSGLAPTTRKALVETGAVELQVIPSPDKELRRD
jgi:hypothetical protein